MSVEIIGAAEPLQFGENVTVKLLARKEGDGVVAVRAVVDCPDNLSTIWGEVRFRTSPRGLYGPNDNSNDWAAGVSADGPVVSGWGVVEALHQFVFHELARRGLAQLVGDELPPPPPFFTRPEWAVDLEGWWEVSPS